MEIQNVLAVALDGVFTGHVGLSGCNCAAFGILCHYDDTYHDFAGFVPNGTGDSYLLLGQGRDYNQDGQD